VLVAACGSDRRPAAHQAAPAAVPLREAANPAFAPDGRLLAIGGDPYGCRDFVGEVADRLRVVRRLPGCTGGASISPDGRAVAQIQEDPSRLSVRRIADGKPRWRARVSRTDLDVPRAYWSPDGRRVITEIGADTGTTVFDAVSGRRVRRIDAGTGYLGRQPFSPDGRRVVVTDGRGVLTVAVASGRRRLLRVRGGLERPAWSPDGAAIAGRRGGAVTWVELATGAVHTVELRDVLEVAWAPDAERIAAYGLGADHGFVSVIDVATGARTEVAAFPEGAEQGELAWSADGSRIAFVVSDPF
jgi:Tol biopolymer transport system component